MAFHFLPGLCHKLSGANPFGTLLLFPESEVKIQVPEDVLFL